jgi:hypothetical protein
VAVAGAASALITREIESVALTERRHIVRGVRWETTGAILPMDLPLRPRETPRDWVYGPSRRGTMTPTKPYAASRRNTRNFGSIALSRWRHGFESRWGCSFRFLLGSCALSLTSE